MAERLAVNEWVVGSSPTSGAINIFYRETDGYQKTLFLTILVYTCFLNSLC